MPHVCGVAPRQAKRLDAASCGVFRDEFVGNMGVGAASTPHHAAFRISAARGALDQRKFSISIRLVSLWSTRGKRIDLPSGETQKFPFSPRAMRNTTVFFLVAKSWNEMTMLRELRSHSK